jgi:DNA invertase Pin-like site-specific DNA recombinase
MRASQRAPKAPSADKFVAYYRVSTARQGRSGLGLEAQRAAVLGYLKGTSGRLLAEITEIESGKHHANRPKLQEAIQRAKLSGSRLIIAKMDRLSRNAAFLLALRDSGVRFVAADLPTADETVVGIMAVIAQREREVIAQRTREALAIARQRLERTGHRLGNPNGARALRRARKGNKAAVAEIVRGADERAEEYRDVLRDVQASGHLSFSAIAAELNRREIETPRGGQWYPASVARLCARLVST